MDFFVDYILEPGVKIGVIVLVLPLLVGYLVLMERKLIAFMQVRLGPMRVGPHGLLQPIADALKLMLKEDIVPRGADRLIFIMAPVVALVPAFIVLSVIPFGPSITVPVPDGFQWPLQFVEREVPLFITDLNIGVLFILAVSSIGVLGIILAGWASNSKYPLLGALRSAAQMVSYEVALGFSIIGVLLLAGSLSLVDIVNAQSGDGHWFVLYQPIAFIVFWICGVAETNRAPFDLPEAESELVAGFHTEYSGFRWSLFFLAEYAAMIVVASLMVTLFFGGWLAPFGLRLLPESLAGIEGAFWFSAKLLFFIYSYIWFRASWPRYRYDQLMHVGWKVLLPIAIANVVATAVLVLLLEG